MAQKRSKKSKQQRRQQAASRRQQGRVAEEQRPEVVPEGPLSPGDRVNLILASFGQTLRTKPFAARAVALVIDYLLCGLLAMVPVTLAMRMVGASGASTLADLHAAGMGIGGLALVLVASLAISCAYYVLVPLRLLPGKTPGKYLTSLEVVMRDGSPATLRALVLRWAVLTLVENPCTFASNLATQFVTLAAGETVGNAFLVLGAIATAFSAWSVWTQPPARLALHDLAAGTWVYVEKD